MDKLHSTMVSVCDRLLLLLTGPQAVTDPMAAEAALEAIELLRVLEGYLKGADHHLPVDATLLGPFRHRAEVSNHVTDVFKVLNEQGFCHPASNLIQ